MTGAMKYAAASRPGTCPGTCEVIDFRRVRETQAAARQLHAFVRGDGSFQSLMRSLIAPFQDERLGGDHASGGQG